MKSLKTTISKGLFVLVLCASGSLYAQNAQAPADNNTNANQDKNAPFDYGQIQKVPMVSNKSYEDTLYRINLDTFEDGGNWYVSMPFDYGRAVLSMKHGVPDGLKNSTNEVQQLSGQDSTINDQVATPDSSNNGGFFITKEDTKKSVLGVKVSFFAGRKTSPWLRIDAVQPIPLDGITKGFEVWVSGRELKHQLYVIIEDSFGKEQLIPLGSLNYLGWRKLTAAVPSYIKQDDPHDFNHRGVVFKGFYIKFDLFDAMGTYYIYFDNLSAQISRYVEENLAKDDIRDNW